MADLFSSGKSDPISTRAREAKEFDQVNKAVADKWFGGNTPYNYATDLNLARYLAKVILFNLTKEDDEAVITIELTLSDCLVTIEVSDDHWYGQHKLESMAICDAALKVPTEGMDIEL